MDAKTLGRYILAAVLFLCWAILLAAWHIGGAVLREMRSEVGHDVLYPAWLAFVAAISVLAWPHRRFIWRVFCGEVLAPPNEPKRDEELPRAQEK